ncbi:hypothetical protein VOLCADRAFT_98405 [Volvox carteri f. nagariensis]|uniref:Guanylate cyclase domain-containing protein n=1 Tax=Volvox carteri f. nagariensis TaxID=3068 RepID=D8UF92_VOLCA|nr:uncharacterized protein VOLCADRAFT_98405 [Volvox carteri f. nagariensis]EFJ41644.1 hypothetical protein VOLCADRAFT_98405 [Volvox carteri f. nagariensis]|eukprot:XP_002957300.1 hypothetical protein VOLCADRAFT_98405 [Volvox carteri f. nagariensis]
MSSTSTVMLMVKMTVAAQTRQCLLIGGRQSKSGIRHPADGEAADGEAANGEAANGEAADSEAADGEAADGEAADGEAADGEAADGEAADGEAADGEAADGEAADGEAADGEAADGEAADGEAADGETADGEAADGEAADGEMLAARRPTARRPTQTVHSRAGKRERTQATTNETTSGILLCFTTCYCRFYLKPLHPTLTWDETRTRHGTSHAESSCILGRQETDNSNFNRRRRLDDLVNVASRMESTGVPGAVHISAATRALLGAAADGFLSTGGIPVKGKGFMLTYVYDPCGVAPQRSQTVSRTGSACTEYGIRHNTDMARVCTIMSVLYFGSVLRCRFPQL